MPITLEQLEDRIAARPAGTSLADVLEVVNVYWSASLTDHIYLIPDVIGKPAAIVPGRLKARFG